MPNKLEFRTRSYATEERAWGAVEKACERAAALNDVHVLLAAQGGRFFPILLPARGEQIQVCISLAPVHGFYIRA